ncbi:MAG TPA: hypothetical protein PK771_05300, partial [Spirochaetota bacterium]|nr:hypothetical protein [Spirochaetota bacterium]
MLFAIKKKNQNIVKAELLIKQRKFKEARDILAKEFSLDPDNEDLIIKLINKIEDEEGKVGETTQAVTKSLLDNDSKRAAELLKDLDKLKGDYSEKVKEIIKTTEIVNEQVTKLNDFYKHLEDGEKSIIKRELSDCIENYGKAIDIFKIKTPERFDDNFVNYANEFDVMETKLKNYGIDSKWLKETKNISFEFVVNEYVKMAMKINEWIKFEDELISLKKKLTNTDIRTKNTIEYQSYELINFSYIDLVRNGITTYSLALLNYIFKLLEKYISEMEKGDMQNKNVVDNLFDLINNKKVENYSHYNLNFNFSRDLYLKRSYINVNEFLEYITQKNNLYARNKIAIVKTTYDVANNYYETYKTNLTDRELQTAEKNIKNSLSYIDGLFKGRDEISKIIFDYNEIMNTKYYKETYDKYLSLNGKIVSLNTNIKNGIKEIEETTFQIKVLLAEANDKYNIALNNYKREKFEEAKDNFTEANDKYFEVLSKVKDREVERRIESAKKFIEEIEQRFYKKDMEIADNQLDNAKKNFYNEKYEEAKKNLDYAESLFNKYNEENDTINYYRERIASAIRIKSGTKVKTDDPAYDHIVELFKNANDSYNTGKKTNDKDMFVTALNFLGQILVEKPYNEDARFLETKILKETDPANFESRFKNYYDKAMAKIDKARASKSKLDYGEALLELQQLLKFEKNVNQINGLINESKKALEFTKKEITVIDKDYANKLVTQAKEFYGKGQYRECLDSANNAIKAWEDVPGAKEIRVAAM